MFFFLSRFFGSSYFIVPNLCALHVSIRYMDATISIAINNSFDILDGIVGIEAAMLLGNYLGKNEWRMSVNVNEKRCIKSKYT